MNRKQYILWNFAALGILFAYGWIVGACAVFLGKPLWNLAGEPTFVYTVVIGGAVIAHTALSLWLVKRRSQNAGRPKIFELYLILVVVGWIGGALLGLPLIGGLTGACSVVIALYLCFARPDKTTTVTYPGEPDVTFNNELEVR